MISPNAGSINTRSVAFFFLFHIIFDEERDRYLILHVGWQDEQRIHGCPVHIDIKDGKIWIQRDFTEAGLAHELVEMGVPKEDIVLAFRSPFVRQFTGFAVA
jgi:hypothetical protein